MIDEIEIGIVCDGNDCCFGERLYFTYSDYKKHGLDKLIEKALQNSDCNSWVNINGKYYHDSNCAKKKK